MLICFGYKKDLTNLQSKTCHEAAHDTMVYYARWLLNAWATGHNMSFERWCESCQSIKTTVSLLKQLYHSRAPKLYG